MKKWRWHILVAAAVVVGVAIAILMPRQRHFTWSMGTPTETGDHPYDMMLFDSLMVRSLPNGYSIQGAKPVEVDDDYSVNGDELFDKNRKSPLYLEIEQADARKQSLLVVQQKVWVKENWEDYATRVASPIRSMLRFALRGGTSLLVLPQNDSRAINDVLNNYYKGSENNLMQYDDCNEYYNDVTPYTPQWFRHRSGKCVEVSGGVQLNERFLDDNFRIYGDLTLGASALAKHHGGLHLKPIMVRKDMNNVAYAIDFYYPATGGHLYVTVLGMYFCNLGLQIPHGTEVLEHLMSKIDHRPVVRIEYEQNINVRENNRSANSAAFLDKIKESEPLSYAWTLALVLVVLILACGLMRRYPVVRGIAADDLDKTDMVAVREYQFRRSPLLHFIFQCSWLYEGKDNYYELFAVNFRRLARIVSRSTGVELQSAKDDELKKAAAIFAARQNRLEQDVLGELRWMKRKNDAHTKVVSPQHFAKSQKIVEHYPLS